MARTAVVRSISLAPDEAALADQLAGYLAGGSFTDLTKILLHWFGEPLQQRLQELVDAGINPSERLWIRRDGDVDAAAEIANFYRPTNPWSDAGPASPSSDR